MSLFRTLISYPEHTCITINVKGNRQLFALSNTLLFFHFSVRFNRQTSYPCLLLHQEKLYDRLCLFDDLTGVKPDNSLQIVESSTLLTDALQLTAIGMGIVFVFLALLVITTHLSSRIINALEKKPSLAHPVAQSPQPASVVKDKRITAVISAAVNRFKQDQSTL